MFKLSKEPLKYTFSHEYGDVIVTHYAKTIDVLMRGKGAKYKSRLKNHKDFWRLPEKPLFKEDKRRVNIIFSSALKFDFCFGDLLTLLEGIVEKYYEGPSKPLLIESIQKRVSLDLYENKRKPRRLNKRTQEQQEALFNEIKILFLSAWNSKGKSIGIDLIFHDLPQPSRARRMFYLKKHDKYWDVSINTNYELKTIKHIDDEIPELERESVMNKLATTSSKDLVEYRINETIKKMLRE